MEVIKAILGKVNVSELILKRGAGRKPSLLKDLIDHPEKFKLEATIEGEEVIVRINRRGPA
jgi:hypothetical protein